MASRALLAGPRKYLGALLVTLLFPLLWLRALRLAGRHSKDDARARGKVLVAIGAGVALAVVGVLALLAFQANAKDGMYENLEDRLALAVGEKEYTDNQAIVETSETTITNSGRTLQTASDSIAAAQADRSEGRLLDESQLAPILQLEDLWTDLVALDAMEDAAIDALPASEQVFLYKLRANLTADELALQQLDEAIAAQEALLASDEATLAALQAIAEPTPTQEAQLLRAQAAVLDDRGALAALEAERSALVLEIETQRSELEPLVEAAVADLGAASAHAALEARIEAKASELGLDEAQAESSQPLAVLLRERIEALYDAALADDLAEDAPEDKRDRAALLRDDLGRVFNLPAAADKARADRAAATHGMEQLQENHDFYQAEVLPAVEARDDEAIEAALAAAPFEYKDPKEHEMQESAAHALEIKQKAVSDMRSFMLWFAYPSVVGMFYAPLAFALGSILARSFVPSETVGFKPYPGGAAGWFLLFGAFGAPSLPFAAWVFLDAENRSVEGQIAL
jgi:hypothetical protein